MLLPHPEVCHGGCGTWGALTGDDVYVVEEAAVPEGALSSSSSSPSSPPHRCPHPRASHRVVTRTAPPLIIAVAGTREAILEVWAQLARPAVPIPTDPSGPPTTATATASHGGLPHRLMLGAARWGPPGRWQGAGALRFPIDEYQRGAAAHAAAGEAAVTHALGRLGAFLRAIAGRPASGAEVAGLGVLLGLAAYHGLVLAALGALLLAATVRLHATLRRDPSALARTFQEGEANLAAAGESLAQVGTLASPVAALWFWEAPAASASLAAALAALAVAALGRRVTLQEAVEAVAAYHGVAVGALAYVILSRWWALRVAQWQHRPPKGPNGCHPPPAINGAPSPECSTPDPAATPSAAHSDDGAEMFSEGHTALLEVCSSHIAPIGGLYGMGQATLVLLLAALASPDCQCEWLDDLEHFTLLSEAAMYPPQREVFAQTVPVLAILMYLVQAAFLRSVYRQLPRRRPHVRHMYGLLLVALCFLLSLGVLDMKRFFLPHVVAAYVYFLTAEIYFIHQTLLLRALFRAAPPGAVRLRHRLPSAFNALGVAFVLLFWYAYLLELPIRSFVEMATLMCQMLSVATTGPLITEILVAPSSSAPTPA